MDSAALFSLLERVQSGDVSVSDAAGELRDLPYQDLGYARLDHHRPIRTGWPEVVFGEGKTPEQIAGIVHAMAGRGFPVLVTRASVRAFEAVKQLLPAAEFHREARCIVAPDGSGGAAKMEGALVITAGTADAPVAEEAALTATLMGCDVTRINDVGVAGLHRVLDQRDRLEAARVIVVAAGMEGALASVVSGLVSAPVIAVPTSIGYGASFDGIAALLGMMNACAPGVAVVNIDNGFGAGYLAAQILHMSARGEVAEDPVGGE